MIRLIFTIMLFFAVSLIGCNKSGSPTEPERSGGGNGENRIAFSGAASGDYDATTGYINTGNAVAISLSAKSGDSNLELLLSASTVSTGSYSVPDVYNVTFSDESKNIIYNFYSGTVEIEEMTETKVIGTFKGNAYGTDLNKFVTDSTKVLSLSAKFSL